MIRIRSGNGYHTIQGYFFGSTDLTFLSDDKVNQNLVILYLSFNFRNSVKHTFKSNIRGGETDQE